MKNLLVILFFSIFSLFSLVVMIFLVFLPKLCRCLNAFSNKNYKTIKKQNTRARRIKRARLRLLFKNQISHEQPTQRELDRSEGIFFDEESQCRLKDEESLLRFNKGQFETVSLKTVLLNSVIYFKQKFHTFRKGIASSNIKSKAYYDQFRSHLNDSVDKYLNH